MYTYRHTLFLHECLPIVAGRIEVVGRVAASVLRGGDARLGIAVGTLPFENAVLGESISVNGACLTVMAFDDAHFDVDASTETLALTTLGELPVGAAVNLERAMRPDDRLGGHLVSGHVDGVGRVRGIVDDAREQRWACAAAAPPPRPLPQTGSN